MSTRTILILCGIVGVLAAVIGIAFKLSGNKSLGELYKQLLFTANNPIIERLEKEAEEIKKDDVKTSRDLEAARDRVDDRKAKMQASLRKKGLKPDASTDDLIKGFEDL